MISRSALRGAWLMLGAAIAVALILVVEIVFGSTVGQSAELRWPLGPQIGVTLLAVPIGGALIGLLPGVRELQITAAQSLLGVDAELLAPSRPTAEHRLRTCVWTLSHAVAGLVTGVLVFAVLPLAVVLPVHQLTGWPAGLDEPVVDRLPAAVTLLGGVVLLAGVLAAVWALGAVAARCAPWALGPTSGDRLALAEARLAQEAQQVVLARELHDGIGHALSIISIQAAGGRRVLQAQPQQAGHALETIEETARTAQAELDQMLALLRDPSSRRHPEPDLDDANELIETHRRLGQQVEPELHLGDTPLPSLVSSTGYRVLAEGLGNAHAHGAGGPVHVRVDDADQLLTIQVTNRCDPPRRRRRSTGGRGLAGLAERVSVLGGSVESGAGPAQQWILAATIPHGDARPTGPARDPESATGRP